MDPKEKQILLRQIAAKIVYSLPSSREDAHAILKIAAQLVDDFLHAETKGGRE